MVHTAPLFESEAEAILRDHLCDRAGKLQDLVLLAHFVDENWAGMKGLGLDRELG